MPATHVYANGQEIASRAVASSGISSSAFPDPCWSPPAPGAGPILLPYPNTCLADSITQGTQTVMIKGKTVAIENQSRFDTSFGNEPATQAFAKGAATGVIKGKAYFTKWSSDVVFEGYGVPRHLDLVTHNHGSMPGNTPTFPYLSRGWVGNDCGTEENRIKRACAPESKDSDSRKAIKSQSKVRRMLRTNAGSKQKGKNWHWTDDHCDGLDTKLYSLEDAKAYADKMKDVFKALPGELNILGALEQELMEMATKAGAKALAKWAAKAGVKQLAGSSVPAIGNALMGIWSAVDAVVAIGDINEIRAVAAESLERLQMLRGKVGELGNLAKEFENFDKLTPEEQLAKAQKVGAAGQDALATLNDCTRARKCMLTPFEGNPKGEKPREHSNNKGCCGGQTGHHLVNGAMMEGACPGYSTSPPNDRVHKDAPTVCVEGTNQTVGSHKRVHDAMDRQVKDLADAGKAAGGTMSLDDTINAAAKSHSEAFPASRCSERCIKNQLESFYKDKCPNARPRAIDKNGKPQVPDGGGFGG